MSEEQLRDLAGYETSPQYTAEERAALRLADALTDTPARLSDDRYRELGRWFSEPQMVELVSAIAWEQYRARFNRAFDVGAEGFSAGAYCPVPVEGD